MHPVLACPYAHDTLNLLIKAGVILRNLDSGVNSGEKRQVRDLVDAVEDSLDMVYRAEVLGQVLTSPKDEFTNGNGCVSGRPPGPFSE